MSNLYDVIIIGAGPAGISAGIYALRAGVKVVVLDKGNSSLKQAKIIQNYYGIENILGEELTLSPDPIQSAKAWLYFAVVALALILVSAICSSFVFYQRRNDD